MSFSGSKAEIKKALESKISNYKCPICGGNKPTIANGYVLNPIHEDLKRVNPHIMGQGIPAIALICADCGFISQHSAVTLGIIIGN